MSRAATENPVRPFQDPSASICMSNVGSAVKLQVGRWSVFGLLLAGVGCNLGYPSDESAPAVQALAARGISVSLTYKSDWRSGYCSRVSVTNTGEQSLHDWQIVINLGQGRLTQVNNANPNLVGARMTVTSPSKNSWISAGDSTSFDFCASAAGPDYHPTLESVAVQGRADKS